MVNSSDDNRSWKRAYLWIKDAIENGTFEMGTRLHENALVKDIGLSRTPIREALRRLEEDDYVRILPSRGAFVSEISMDDIREIYEVRKLLEPFAGLSAALTIPDTEIERITKLWEAEKKKLKPGRAPDLSAISDMDLETHLTLLRYAHNRRIAEIISSYHSQIKRLQRLSAKYLANTEETIREHLEIMCCLKERNPNKLRSLLYDHIVSSEANIMKDYFLK